MRPPTPSDWWSGLSQTDRNTALRCARSEKLTYADWESLSRSAIMTQAWISDVEEEPWDVFIPPLYRAFLRLRVADNDDARHRRPRRSDDSGGSSPRRPDV